MYLILARPLGACIFPGSQAKAMDGFLRVTEAHEILGVWLRSQGKAGEDVASSLPEPEVTFDWNQPGDRQELYKLHFVTTFDARVKHNESQILKAQQARANREREAEETVLRRSRKFSSVRSTCPLASLAMF